ncbi:LamG domain-containing protein [uncultured Draconibacterium sp.]|uniref:LamG domain-containing protein n=1 Tax=uncultured Draconibacterium sp. TaxID=1573823 RepID=UPI0025D0C9E2|nr:LamG domain-containing protein [uncultured Draconibacterium sp.]
MSLIVPIMKPVISTPSGGLLTYLRLSTELNEASGSTVYDSSDNNNDGTNVNCTVNQTGILDKCYSFPGSNSGIEIPDNNSLDLTEAITVCSWVYLSDVASGGVIAAKRSNAYYAWDFSSSRVSGYAYFGPNNNAYRANTGESIPIGEWCMLTGTFDRSSVKVYINGTLKGSYTYNTAINTNSEPVYIGRRGSGFTFNDTQYWGGLIDATRIFSIALDATAITWLWNSGNGRTYSELQNYSI